MASTVGGRFNFITVQGQHLFKRSGFHSINPILKWTQLFIWKCVILIRSSIRLIIQHPHHLPTYHPACYLSHLQ